MAEDINDIGLLLDFQDDRNYDKILYCSEKKMRRSLLYKVVNDTVKSELRAIVQRSLFNSTTNLDKFVVVQHHA